MPRLPCVLTVQLSLLMLGLVACARSQTEVDKSTTLENPVKPEITVRADSPGTVTSVIAKEPRIGVELLNTGNEPRRELRYEMKANYVALFDVQSSFKNMDDKMIRDESFIAMAFVESSENGVFLVGYSMIADENGKLIDDEDRIDDADNQLFGLLVTLNNIGQPRSSDFFGESQVLSKKYRVEVSALLNVPWLPAEPLGIGARWNTHTPILNTQPALGNKVAVSELVSIDGSVITIETTTTIDSPGQRTTAAGQQIHTTKRTILDLSDPVSMLPLSYELVSDSKKTQPGKTAQKGMSGTVTTKRLGTSVLND